MGDRYASRFVQQSHLWAFFIVVHSQHRCKKVFGKQDRSLQQTSPGCLCTTCMHANLIQHYHSSLAASKLCTQLWKHASSSYQTSPWRTVQIKAEYCQVAFYTITMPADAALMTNAIPSACLCRWHACGILSPWQSCKRKVARPNHLTVRAGYIQHVMIHCVLSSRHNDCRLILLAF